MSLHALQSNVVAGPWQAATCPPPPPMPPAGRPERRRGPPPGPETMRQWLNPAQLETLEALEIFKWRLAFVRRPMFQPPIPVVFDADGTRFVVILEDGTLDEHPTLRLRN